MEPSKADWKLFQSKIGDWQEAYMERLIAQYIKLLKKDGLASDKFWDLEERIKKDKKKPGVLIHLSKQDMYWDIAKLVHDKVITMDDLTDFSKDTKESVQLILSR